VGRGMQCFKPWRRDRCECSLSVACNSCCQNLIFEFVVVVVVQRLRPVLNCVQLARVSAAVTCPQFMLLCRFHVGLHDIVEPSMHSQVCAATYRCDRTASLPLVFLFVFAFVCHFCRCWVCRLLCSAAAGYTFANAQVLFRGDRVRGHGVAGVLGLGKRCLACSIACDICIEQAIVLFLYRLVLCYQ
jgi:hypothetical protein